MGELSMTRLMCHSMPLNPVDDLCMLVMVGMGSATAGLN
jgi:hypothetical protein